MRQKYLFRATAGIVAALIAVPVGGFPALAVVAPQAVDVVGALAAPCGEVESVFVRGSGEVLNDVEADRFNDQLRSRVDPAVSRHHYELGSESIGGELYQAVDVGGDSWNNLWRSLSAAMSAGGAFEYGSSVDSGVAELSTYLTERAALCPAAVFVLGGFSQGAQVIGETYSEVLPDVLRERIVYQALFGDPKLHLPEGEGSSPAACRGEGYSAWRSGVPGCRVAECALGGRKPYLPTGFESRTGTFCHNADFVCGSSPFFWDGDGHNTYADPGDDVDAAVAEIAARLEAVFPAGGWVNASSDRPGIHTAPASGLSRLAAVIRQPYYYAQPGQQVTFDASASSTPDARATSYEWDYNGDGVFEETTLGPITTHTYAQAVDGVVEMRITDSTGAVANASTRVHIGTSLDDSFPNAPTAVTVRRTSSGSSGSVTVNWASADPSVHRWGLTVDGTPVGMVEGSTRSAVIADVRFDQAVEIGVVGFNSKGGIGAAASVPLAALPAMSRSGDPRVTAGAALIAVSIQQRSGDRVGVQPLRRPRSRRDCRPMRGTRRPGLASAGQVRRRGPAVRSGGPWPGRYPALRPSPHILRPPIQRAVAVSGRRR